MAEIIGTLKTKARKEFEEKELLRKARHEKHIASQAEIQAAKALRMIPIYAEAKVLCNLEPLLDKKQLLAFGFKWQMIEKYPEHDVKAIKMALKFICSSSEYKSLSLDSPRYNIDGSIQNKLEII